ncbi:MAG: DNA translocase FtsK 4TM domain-containing protein [Lactobacillales bacterium]|nr:DNA translocase FtsK 4TM domain-containing protein [Lactobacillales bacterium]
MIKALLKLIWAVFLMIFGIFAGVSCISYHVADTSLNTASGGIQNWMGGWGAVIADFLWQGFGWMSPVIVLAAVMWGIFLIWTVRFIHLRLYLLIPAVLLGCWLLAQAPIPLTRFTVAGNGGFAGYYLVQWGTIGAWYFHVLLWALFVSLVVFSFKIPAFKVFTVCGQAFYALAYAIKSVFVKLFSRKDRVPVPKKTVAREKTKEKEAVPPTVKLAKAVKRSNFVLPLPDLLAVPKTVGNASISKEMMAKVSEELTAVLKQFGIGGRVVHVNPGPVVTLYEFEPAAGIKTSRVIALADDIAREMRALSVRIALVPGSNTIGIEMPNARRDTVYIRELVEDIKYQGNSGVLPLILGKDIGGTPVYADLAKMPHLLVAGTTGSGKSVAINTMILSLLYRFTPAECRMIMVDPKMLELSVYNGIPHLLTPVVTDPGKAVVALKWAVREMEDRYRAMSQLGVRNIDGYNQKLAQAARDNQILTRRVQTGFDPETGAPVIEEQKLDLTPLPYIVIIVDEMADLMMLAGKDVEGAIQRLAQMARAAGIHLILATQRPSVDVITGTIKSNFPTRMSFQVTSKIDSRTILGESGAEQLLGKGDMLYMPAGQKPARIHGPFVSDDEIEKVVKHVCAQGEPVYLDAILVESDGGNAGGGSGGGMMGGAEGGGDLYDQAVAVVLRDGKVSTSYVQRQLRIGYNKAADLIDRMEAEGIISKPGATGKREILVPRDNA